MIDRVNKEIKMITKYHLYDIIRCDICNKLIGKIYEDQREPEDSDHKYSLEGNYFEVDSCHQDWGNDSRDSYTEEQICSDECLKIRFNQYLDDCKFSHTQEISFTQKRFYFALSKEQMKMVLKETGYDRGVNK